MKRILLVTDIFPPAIGGPATFIDHLAHKLSSLGHKVTVVCTSSGVQEPSDIKRPFKVIRVFSRLWIFHVYKLIPILAWQMLRHDAILVNGLEYSTYWGARLTGRKYVLKLVGDSVWEEARGSGETALSVDDFQEITPTSGRLQRLRKWREQYMSGAKQIIVPSVYLQGLVARWSTRSEKIKVIYNGVSLEIGETVQPQIRANEYLQVAFVGRLTNWKGVETLLLAASRVPNIQVNIIGTGPEYPMLVGLSKQLKIEERVKFLGGMTQEELLDSLKKMDALVLGSSYEGLSHTLLEAGALGLACIASDSGGNPEIIKHKENGLLFPYGNVKCLSDALQELQDNEALRFQLAYNAKKYAAQFDFLKTVFQTIDILLGL